MTRNRRLFAGMIRDQMHARSSAARLTGCARYHLPTVSGCTSATVWRGHAREAPRRQSALSTGGEGVGRSKGVDRLSASPTRRFFGGFHLDPSANFSGVPKRIKFIRSSIM